MNQLQPNPTEQQTAQRFMAAHGIEMGPDDRRSAVDFCVELAVLATELDLSDPIAQAALYELRTANSRPATLPTTPAKNIGAY